MADETDRIDYVNENLDPFFYLPIEMLMEIFSYLDTHGLINCGLVSRKFKFCVDQFKIRELTITDVRSKYDSSWFFQNKPINFNYTVKSTSNYLKEIINNELINLKFLKKLKIDNFRESKDFDLVNLSSYFQYLETLEIVIKSSNRKRLSFPHLKTLKITTILTGFTLKAPSLINVYLDAFEFERIPINFIYPLSIKYVQLAKFTSSIFEFRNLEYLEVCLWEFDKINFLTKLDNLKELQLIRSIFQCHNVSDTKQKLIELWKLKSNIPKLQKNLNFFYNAVKIEKFDDIHEFFKRDFTELQFSNYSRTSPEITWMRKINYNELIDHDLPNNIPIDLSIDLPIDFFRKYSNIQIVIVSSKIENQTKFINFISKCNNLSKLLLQNSNLNNQFYDRLPIINNSFTQIKIEEDETKFINFNFISKMMNLQYFATNLELDLNAFDLNKFIYLKEFRFNLDDYQLVYIKLGTDNYLINSTLEFKCTYDEILISFNQLKKKESIIIRRSHSKESIDCSAKSLIDNKIESNSNSSNQSTSDLKILNSSISQQISSAKLESNSFTQLNTYSKKSLSIPKHRQTIFFYRGKLTDNAVNKRKFSNQIRWQSFKKYKLQ